jgi:hypothetical protein
VDKIPRVPHEHVTEKGQHAQAEASANEQAASEKSQDQAESQAALAWPVLRQMHLCIRRSVPMHVAVLPAGRKLSSGLLKV